MRSISFSIREIDKIPPLVNSTRINIPQVVIEIIMIANPISLSLKKIEISGYRSIAHTEVELKKINILLGANGVGKSNFISTFDLLNAVINRKLQLFFAENGGANTQFYYGTKTTEKISVKVFFGDNTYSFSLGADTDDKPYFLEEETTFHIRSRYAEPYSETLGTGHRETKLWDTTQKSLGKDKKTVSDYVLEYMVGWIVYHFHDTGKYSPLKSTSDIDEISYLHPDGKNLAAYLYNIKAEFPQHYGKICSTIQLVYPEFEDFIFIIQEEANTVRLRWKNKYSRHYTFSISALSDGTLRFIALTTLLLQPNPPKFILIDEPELGLHPYAIDMLSDLIHIASNKSQILLSTQSVQLVNNFHLEDILIAENKDGQTTITRPQNIEELNEWMEDYTLGELWQNNLLGGNP